MSDEFISADPDPYDPQTEQLAVQGIKTKRELDLKLARDQLEIRKGAYRRVLVEGTPSRDDRTIVLEDLMRFCRAGQTVYSDNERIHCLLSGRQEVYLRINDFTQLSVDALVEKYTST